MEGCYEQSKVVVEVFNVEKGEISNSTSIKEITERRLILSKSRSSRPPTLMLIRLPVFPLIVMLTATIIRVKIVLEEQELEFRLCYLLSFGDRGRN